MLVKLFPNFTRHHLITHTNMLLATKQAKFADFICWQYFSFKIKEFN